MARYTALWEVDSNKTPEDPKTKKAQWLSFQETIMKQLKEGIIKDWGAFVGERCGYVICEGAAVDLHTLTVSWVPFVKFKASEVLTIDQVNKATKALPD